MLTVALLINRACQKARTIGFTAQALDELNIILGDLCETYDLALARGLYNFTFDPGLTQSTFGSGPYPLPLDYLRTSGSSGSSGTQRSVWYDIGDGVPRALIPCDLSEFDMQIQQPGQQSYPWLFATDMGGPLTDRITTVLTGSTTAGLATVTGLSNIMGLTEGNGIAGEGIVPGTTIRTYAGGGATSLTLSQPAEATNPVASLFSGIPPVAYVYWPPAGNYPAVLRYQKKMPPIQSTQKIPWFPNEGYLRDKLTAVMMGYSSDSRMAQLDAKAEDDLRKYLALKDDNSNRSEQVQLDRRNFGPSWPRLRNTKAVGWGS